MNNRTIHVLSIEDDLADAMLIQDKLVEAQRVAWDLPRFEVKHVGRLKAGLKKLEDHDFDVVLSDLDLPDSRAGETVATLRQHIPQMPLVVLTGREDEALAHKSVRAGVQDYLYKDEATGSLLARTMMYAIERQQIHSELEQRVDERTAELRQANEELQRANRALEAESAERKRAEATLQESEERLRTVLENLPAGVFAHDFDGNILLVNKAASRHTGYSRSELLSMSVADIDPGSVTRDDRARLWHSLDVGDFTILESTHVRKDGTQHPAEIHLSAVRLRGQPTILALAFDITERKQMEKTLQESEATARSLINAPTDVAALIDTEGLILDANETMADGVNIPVDELIGMCVWDLFPPDVADYRKAVLERVIQSGESIRFEDSRANIWYDSVVYPIRDAQNEITKVAIIARDITELKRAKEALRESKARLALAIKGAALGMWDWNIQSGDLVLNERWADMLGYTLDEIELTIDTWKRLVHPDDLPAVMEALNAHLEGKTPIYQTEHRLRTKSGAWKWVLDTGKVMVYDDQGRPLRATGTHQDITERKRTEQALQRRTESLRAINDLTINLVTAPPSTNHFKLIADELKSITNALGISVSSHDPDQQALTVEYIAANGKLVSRFRNLLERKVAGLPTPISDQHYAEITDEVMRKAPNLHEISLGTVPQPVSAAAQRMFGIDHCIALALTDGDELLGSAVIVMPKGQTSPSDEVIKTFARVATASLRQRQAEEALRKSEERLQLAMDAGEHGFWDWNLDTDELYFSPQYCKMLGYGPTELPMVKKTWVDLMHPEDRETVMPKIERHVANAEPYAVEFRLKCKDGSWKWISGHGKSYKKDEDGLPHRAVGVHVDITERKRAEKKIRRYAADLERSNRELEQFGYAISHDLQAPLRTMRGYAHLLKQNYSDQLDARAEKFIDRISGSAGRMKVMIEALLDLSRVETGGKTFTAVDCEGVLEHVLDDLSLTLEGKDAKVTHDPLPTVMADEAQLAQVFQNLIANAVKFRREDAAPQVHISAERGDQAWIFSVGDNGIGIASEQSERIFQVFQRLHPEEEYPGLGIGLALCRRIVERHGGRIWVEPKTGPGSTFRFTIPLQNA